MYRRVRLDLVLLLAALAVIGLIVGWWNVFSRRLIEQNRELQMQLVGVADQVDGKAERLKLMIVGESAILALMLTALVVGLWWVARERQRRADQFRRFVQFTGHEFKTPVAGLRSLLEAFQAGRIPDASKTQLLNRGLDACDALEHLTDSMLVLQRSRALEPAEVGQADALQLVLSIVDHRRVAHVGEEVVVGDLKSAQVRADHDAVRVVMENLFDNARKYGGAKTVVSSSLVGDRCRISITDAGRGFAPDDAERLFSPERGAGAGTTAAVVHGSGLGLHLSRELARAMGGDLVAESAGPGLGAAFHLFLQRAKEASR